MKRTISLKLAPTDEQAQALTALQAAFADACNHIVPSVVTHRCWNRVALHHRAYYPIRASSPLGSQMVCNAIKAVCDAYRALRLKRTASVPVITFRATGSIHYDQRTYRLTPSMLSLYTLTGRIHCTVKPGAFQVSYLANGVPKEAELMHRRKQWFFNVVLDLPDPQPLHPSGSVLGVDVGENVVASTSMGTLFGGGQLRHTRDCYLALRRRLQSNGSQSARQRLHALSGRETRHVCQINHEISKAIVQEALAIGARAIVMETLTHIRRRIRARKRERTRLHRWAWAELQRFIEYKAQGAGLTVQYVNPAYTSQTCSCCGARGRRVTHRFACPSCGILAHSDVNSSRNLVRIASSAEGATGAVTRPHVAGQSA
ncbi:MAG: IS200/IS605 family element transposase accessory protein TnpB [Candidatus Latescibacteria bacterium]|nr:IS200/IS605 family element transposase accessory protein TnpB [Candidatus Latescibacterota bacterium]